MVKRIGAITVGQSPRIDIVPEIKGLLGNVEIVEAGALDGLSYEEILQFAPSEKDYVLVTKLRDGRSVKISESYILQQIQKLIDQLTASGTDGIVMFCSGEFPEFSCTHPILYPQILLQQFVTVVAKGKKLGVINPDASQAPQALKRWSKVPVSQIAIEAASPYTDPDKIWQAASALKSWGAEMVVMDCMGFNQSMKQEVARIVGVPVILPRTVAARAVAELFS
jgi:protein AroM